MTKTENPISALGRFVAGLAKRSKAGTSTAADAARLAPLEALLVTSDQSAVAETVAPLTPSEIAVADERRWDRLKASLNAELPDMQAAGLSHDDTVKALRLLCGAEIRDVETALMQAALASGRVCEETTPGRAMAVSRRVVETFVFNYVGQIRRRHGLGEDPPGRRFGPGR